MKIYLDDRDYGDRKTPEGWVHAYNFDDFKKLVREAIAKGEPIEALSFDNDLGEGTPEGHDILKWFCTEHPELLTDELTFASQSSNGWEKKRMLNDFEWHRQHREDLIEAKSRPETGVEYTRLK